jgi:hypothetical protein
MPWQPLPDDVPLDHEALTPPPHMDDPTGKFTPLPDDAPLDDDATLVDRPKADDAPIIIGAIRPHGKQPQEVNPSYTEAGFDGELHPDTQYHSQLSKDDKAEYANFFKDPKSPPSAAALGLWYHQKTGAYLANAQDIVDKFKSTGKFSTTEKISIPTKSQGAGAAYLNHTANALAADYGPEGAAILDALGLGGDERKSVFNSDGSLGNIWANNADAERAQLDADTAAHPVASMGGELTGVALASPLLAKAGNAAGLAKLAEREGEFNRTLVQGSGEGFAYGSGAGGPGHRLEGGATGAAMVPAVAGVAKIPVAAANMGKTVLEGSPGLARRIIAKAIKDDAHTPESIGQSITESQANDVPAALGDQGENLRGLMAASSRASGVGRTIVRDALETRQAALADRITGHIERDLGPVSNPHQVADELMTKARTEAAPLYDSFYGSAPVASPAVDAMMARPSMQKALKNAYRIAKEEGRDPETLGFKVGEDGNVDVEPAYPSSAHVTAYHGGRAFEGGFDPSQAGTGMGSSGERAVWFTPDREEAGRYAWNVGGQGYAGKAVYPAKIDTSGFLVVPPREYDPSAFSEIIAKARDEGKPGVIFKSVAEDARSGADQIAVIDSAHIGKGFGGAGTPQKVKTYTPQTLDYIKRGMDDVVESYRDKTSGKLVLDTEGRAVNNTLRSYMGTVDRLFPDYAKARAAYAGPVKGIGAMNTGRKFLNMTADDIEARMRDMTPYEKDMAALGARRAMAELVQSKGDTADIVHALVGTGKKRAMLARLFGDRKQFQRFVDTLGQEKEGWRSFRQALLGSPTASNLSDDAALEGAAMAADFAAGGMPVATATSKAFKFLRFKLGEKAQQQIAALLSNTDPAAIRELAAELRTQAEKRGLRVRKVNTLTNAVGKGALVTQAQ